MTLNIRDVDQSALVDTPALQRMSRPPSPPPHPAASVPAPPARDPKRTSIFSIGRLRRSAPPAAAGSSSNVQVSAIPLPNGSVVRAMDVFGEVMKQAAYLHGRASGEIVDDQGAEGDELDWERIKTLPRVRLVPPEEDESEPVLLYPPAPQRPSMPSFPADERDSSRLHATIAGGPLMTFEPSSSQNTSTAEPSSKRLSMSVAGGGSASSGRGIWGGMSPGFSQPPPVFRRTGQRPGSGIVMPRKKEQVVPEIRPKAMPGQSSSPPRVRGSSIPVPSLPHPFPSVSLLDSDGGKDEDDENVPLSVHARRAMSDPPPGVPTSTISPSRASTFPLPTSEQAHSFIDLDDHIDPSIKLPPSPSKESSPRRKSRAMSLTSILASKNTLPSDVSLPPVPPLPAPSVPPKTAAPPIEPDRIRLKKQKSLKNFFFAGTSGWTEPSASVSEGKRRKSDETESSGESASASSSKMKRKEKAPNSNEVKEEGSLRKRFSLSNMSQAFKKRSLGPGSGGAVPKVPDLPAEFKKVDKASMMGKAKSKTVPDVLDSPEIATVESLPAQRCSAAPDVGVGGFARGSTPPPLVSSVGGMEFSPVVQSPTSIDPPVLPDLDMDIDGESDASSLFSLDDVELGSASPSTQQQARRATIMRVVPRYPIGFDLQEMMGMSTVSLPSHRVGNLDDSPDSPISMGPLLPRRPLLALNVDESAAATTSSDTSSSPSDEQCQTPESDEWHSAESRPSSETDSSSSQPHTPLEDEAPTQHLLPAIPLPDVDPVDQSTTKIITETNMLMSPSLSLTLRDPGEVAPDLSPVSRVASTPKSRFSSPEGMLRMMASPRSNRSSFSGASVRTGLRNSTPPRLNDIPVPAIPDAREYNSLMSAVQLRSLKFDALGLDFEAFGGRKQAVEAA